MSDNKIEDIEKVEDIEILEDVQTVADIQKVEDVQTVDDSDKADEIESVDYKEEESIEKGTEEYITENVEYDDEDEIEIESVDLKNIERYKDDIQKESFDSDKDDSEEDSIAKKVVKVIWEYGKIFIVAALLAIFINSFIIVNAHVPTGSMENTIDTDSRIIGLRLSYMFGDPERGDIIVFKNPFDESENYVKRIIGLPGERVEIVNSEIYIYDKDGNVVEGPLDEPYLKEEWKIKNSGIVFNVPEGCYLTLGDNRNGSFDARGWKEKVEANPEMYNYDYDMIYIKKEKILGKVYFQYWGDNGFEFNWLDGENVNY